MFFFYLCTIVTPTPHTRDLYTRALVSGVWSRCVHRCSFNHINFDGNFCVLRTRWKKPKQCIHSACVICDAVMAIRQYARDMFSSAIERKTNTNLDVVPHTHTYSIPSASSYQCSSLCCFPFNSCATLNKWNEWNGKERRTNRRIQERSETHWSIKMEDLAFEMLRTTMSSDVCIHFHSVSRTSLSSSPPFAPICDAYDSTISWIMMTYTRNTMPYVKFKAYLHLWFDGTLCRSFHINTVTNATPRQLASRIANVLSSDELIRPEYDTALRQQDNCCLSIEFFNLNPHVSCCGL